MSWVSLSSIFLSGLYVETGYGIFFFYYLLMIATYVLAVARTGSLGIRRGYGTFFALLAGVSCLGFLISAPNYGIDVGRFASGITRIVMLAFFILFFTTVYNLCAKSAKLLFQRYLKVAYFFSGLGIFQEVVFIVLGVDFLSPILSASGAKHYGSYLGIAGLSVEPAFYACALLPAGAYHVSEFTRSYRVTLPAAAVVIAILLSTSSLGYIGLFISAVISILLRTNIRNISALAFAVPLFSLGAYQASQLEFFQLRLNDTLSVLQGAELTMSTGMNISTYSNAVNMSMSMRSVQDNYGFGTGFGTYSVVFDHYISDYEMPGYRDDLPGRGSATSLFARLTAETGLAAWAFFAVLGTWLLRGIRSDDSLLSIKVAYLATMAIILLRMGEYFANGVVLVFLMIYWIHREKRHSQNACYLSVA